MSSMTHDPGCQRGCWIAAAVAGVLTFFGLFLVSGKSFFAAAILGALVFVLLGLLLRWLFCSSVPQLGAEASTTAATAMPAATSATSTSKPAASSSTAAKDASAAAAVDTTDQTKEAPAPEAKGDASTDTSTTGAGETTASEPTEADAGVVKPSAELSGEAELAARKGEWRYEGETGGASGETGTTPASAPSKDYDGDGVVEGTGEGEKPATLAAARDGGADDLKKIKGIGPKLEQLCNSMGFFHFDQIAAWSDQEVAWVNANLAGFKGRVSRDNWVEQAKLLATGGETEFSKRVDKGSVY